MQHSLLVCPLHHSDKCAEGVEYLHNALSLKSCSASLAPGVVTGLTRGPVSVSEDGSIQQKITWNAPTSPGADIKYLIKYGLDASSPDEASLNKTTTSTMLTLSLSVPEGSPDKVIYKIWVAAVTGSQEQGNFTMLTIQYSSKLGNLNSYCMYTNNFTGQFWVLS